MIELTRLNGEHMVVNSDLIRYAEASPDTVVTLVTGEKLVVTESIRELIERVIAFRSRLLQTAFPQAVTGNSMQYVAATAASASQATATALPQPKDPLDRDESWRRRGRDTD
jgi:flagellar protein FlbD